jgi:hypothetical protein
MSRLLRAAARIAPVLGPRRAPRIYEALARLAAPVLPASLVVRERNRRHGLPADLESATLGNFGRYLGEFLSVGGGGDDMAGSDSSPACDRSSVSDHLSVRDRSPVRDSSSVRDRVRALSGRVNVAEAARSIAAGRAALAVTPHFGNWELGALMLREAFGPVSVIIRTTGDPGLDAAIRICRGDNLLLDVAEGSRGILAALARPGVVAAAIDEPRRDGVPVEFLGRTARFPSGLFRMAKQTNAAIHPTRCRRNSAGKIDLEVYSEARSAQEVAARFEEWIREDPAQWVLLAR